MPSSFIDSSRRRPLAIILWCCLLAWLLVWTSSSIGSLTIWGTFYIVFWVHHDTVHNIAWNETKILTWMEHSYFQKEHSSKRNTQDCRSVEGSPLHLGSMPPRGHLFVIKSFVFPTWRLFSMKRSTHNPPIGLWTLSPRWSADPEPTIPFPHWSAVSHPKSRDFWLPWRHFRLSPPALWSVVSVARGNPTPRIKTRQSWPYGPNLLL